MSARSPARLAATDRDLLTALLVIGVLLIGVLNWVFNWARRILTVQVLGDVVLAMRTDAFRAVMNHDMSFFDQNQSARIVSRITSDTDEFSRVAVVLTDLFSQVLLVVILLAYLFTINWQLTLLLALLAPVAFIVAGSYRAWARRVTRHSQQAVADVNASIQEAVTGIAVSKNFRREQGIYDEFLGVNSQSYGIHVQRGFVLSLIFPTLQFFSGIGTALLLYMGGYYTYLGTISAGGWFLFMNSVGLFWFPMINLSAFWSQFQGALSATERIFALIDAEPAVFQTGSDAVETLTGDIRFEQVDFRYGDKEQVLHDFNLHIRPGESVALVGHTGAGKSSIAKLVTRFYEFQGGTLLVDGRDIRTLDLRTYRRRLGIVSQQPFLFAGSVADNIRYAMPGLSDERCGTHRPPDRRRRMAGDAARRPAHRCGRARQPPEHGAAPTGRAGAHAGAGPGHLYPGRGHGQRRSLHRDPDPGRARPDPGARTSIVIAHRLSTVKACDRILVLDHGRIIEQGSHDALMARGGHYASLYETYFRHQSLEFLESRRRATTPA